MTKDETQQLNLCNLNWLTKTFIRR